MYSTRPDWQNMPALHEMQNHDFRKYCSAETPPSKSAHHFDLQLIKLNMQAAT